MALEIIVVFESLQDPLKIDFSANMAATCPQLGPQHAPLSWAKDGAEIGPDGLWDPMDPHGAPLNQVWIDFGLNFDRFWVDFWLFFVACWVHFMHIFHCSENLVVVCW